MSKRARGDGGRFISSALTGGTGDVKPQITTGSVSVVVDDYGVARARLPVARIGAERGRAMVFEILKVWWYQNIQDVGDTAYNTCAYLSTRQERNSGDACTLVTIAEDLVNPQTFACQFTHKGVVVEGATLQVQGDTAVDMTDGAGNGIIIATDSIFIHGGNVGGIATATHVVKILYRLVNVGLAEYIGIVQSQQA